METKANLDWGQKANEHKAQFAEEQWNYGRLVCCSAATLIAAGVLRRLNFAAPALLVGGALAITLFAKQFAKVATHPDTLRENRNKPKDCKAFPSLQLNHKIASVKKAIVDWPELYHALDPATMLDPGEALTRTELWVRSLRGVEFATRGLTGACAAATVGLALTSFRKAQSAFIAVPQVGIPHIHWADWRDVASTIANKARSLGQGLFGLTWGPRTRGGDFLLGAASSATAGLCIYFPIRMAITNLRLREEDRLGAMLEKHLGQDNPYQNNAVAWLKQYGHYAFKLPITNMKAATIKNIVEDLANRSELTIKDSPDLNDADLKEILPKLIDLKTLVIEGCSGVKGSFLEKVPGTVTQLTISSLEEVPTQIGEGDNKEAYETVTIGKISEAAATFLAQHLYANELKISSLNKPTGSNDWTREDLENAFKDHRNITTIIYPKS